MRASLYARQYGMIGFAMWESIYHVQTLIVDQWNDLSDNGKILTVAVGIVALFYLAKNSHSLTVNVVTAMVLLTLAAYVIMRFAGRV